MFKRLSFACAVLMIFGTAFAVQAKDLAFPDLTGRVVDDAHVLQPQTIGQLNQRLEMLETQTGHQLVVATLNEIGDTDIADYGYQLGRQWQIGQAGKNDGVILILVPATRQVRIEVGYGLEGDLTDATSALIINNIMIPLFKQDRLDEGVLQGAEAIISVIKGDGQAVVKKARSQTAEDQLPYFLIALLIIWVFSRLSRGRSSVLAPFIIGNLLGSRGSGGGGFGGFGGGGGSFGGGGASGRW